ncbi:MAG: tripartite tricarboxylate transporter substrate-binding protein [Acetobacterales bacterium]
MTTGSVFGRRLAGVSAAFMLAALAPFGAAAQEPVKVGGFPGDTLNIMAPASAGGGWDGTARAVQEALNADKIAATGVDVFNRPGAGGTVGLAALSSQYRGQGHTAMITGLTMVGSTIINKSPVKLTDTTPIARLITEYQVVVVGKGSKYDTLEQVISDFKSNPGGFVWGGGPGGGPDHTTVGLISKAVGVPIAQLRYAAFSGGETRANIMGNQVSAGVAGYGEVKGDAAAGLVKILAVSSPERLPGADYPTLREKGIDVEFSNWRGIVGPPDMPEDARKAWIQMMQRLQSSPKWQELVKQRNWTEAFLFGDDLTRHINAELQRVEALFTEFGLIK